MLVAKTSNFEPIGLYRLLRSLKALYSLSELVKFQRESLYF